MNTPGHKHVATMPTDFDLVTLKLASPERIREWSYGEVTKPETINYRTQRSEKNGLFDERIFGPERDFECYCGKYKGIRYRGITCEKCGVEITRSIVRRERMGHIELATPVAHIWFLKNIPSRIALLIDATMADVEKVVYFAGYIVTSVSEEERAGILKAVELEYKTKKKTLKDDKSKEALKGVYLSTKRDVESIQEGAILDEMTYSKYAFKYSTLFEAEIGAEALYNVLRSVDLEALEAEIRERVENGPAGERKKQHKRLSLVGAMRAAGVRPEWMFLKTIPVIPAAVRPMVALDGGRHATSDLNDLYRRVINRNNRLKKLMEINAPNVILRNEKRILQEAVDALIDNSMRSGATAVGPGQRRPLKSLSDNLKGKQGIFRQNLLGKRVDYSGRSVIVVGPELNLNQCGLPKHMALELFRPFIISKLLSRELAFNIRGAGRLIDEMVPEVWAILEEVIADKFVLLNRAPTLHRLGIQAFKPVLIEGNAIQIHPLVVQAFNADFDGDQMAVHVPLSAEAQREASEIMASNKNLLRPGSGTPILSVGHQDIALGCYWMTKSTKGEEGEGKFFATPNDAIAAYDFGAVSLRATIKVLPTDKDKYSVFDNKYFETTIGRLLFNSVLPDDYPFLNVEITKKEMLKIVDDMIESYDNDTIMKIVDKIKNFGFKYSTMSGITFGMDDAAVPEKKQVLVDKARRASAKVNEQFEEGLLSRQERLRMDVEIWQKLRIDMEELIGETLDPDGSIHDMWKSGARGNIGQITNMAGLKGLIAGPSGRVIDFPIISSKKEGFTPIEYFISTHGSRKGLGDTALKTAESGYLTRRLFDVGQDVVVTEEDCKTKAGILARPENLSGIEVPLHKAVLGRFLAEDAKGEDGSVVFKKGTYIDTEKADTLDASNVESVLVRSPMTCETLRGVCVKCYGRDLSTNAPVVLGEAVGTIAAQSIGEPATQLTMRTFHAGGTAAVGGDITGGLPRVQELFERRPPKNPAVISEVDGVVSEIKDAGQEKIITVLVDVGSENKKDKKESVDYTVRFRRMSLVSVGDTVVRGQFLTDGSADLMELFALAGREKTQEYIIREISKIYELQGAAVNRKHIEVIVKRMFARLRVTDPGDTAFVEGDTIERSQLVAGNKTAKKPAEAKPLLMGITNVALSRDSFLSASSFQNTNRILIRAAIRGKRDDLSGLKENVMIGRLIPAGTGFVGSPKQEMIAELQKEIAAQEEEGEE